MINKCFRKYIQFYFVDLELISFILSKFKSELKNIDEPENHAVLNIIFMVLGN